MPEAVVVAQYVNQPQAGKKLGSIKTPEGQYYGVPPAMLGMFKSDGTYKIFYESREFQGKTYHTVKTVTEVMAPPKAEGKGGHDDRGPKSWVCHLLGQAIAAGKIDALALSDIVEAGRIYRDAERLIFSDEPMPEQRSNGPAPKPNYATGPAPGMPPRGQQPGQSFDEEMGDQVPF